MHSDNPLAPREILLLSVYKHAKQALKELHGNPCLKSIATIFVDKQLAAFVLMLHELWSNMHAGAIVVTSKQILNMQFALKVGQFLEEAYGANCYDS